MEKIDLKPICIKIREHLKDRVVLVKVISNLPATLKKDNFIGAPGQTIKFGIPIEMGNDWEIVHAFMYVEQKTLVVSQEMYVALNEHASSENYSVHVDFTDNPKNNKTR